MQYYDLNYNISDHEAIVVIKTYLSNRYEIVHLHSHQNKNTEQRSVISSLEIKPISR